MVILLKTVPTFFVYTVESVKFARVNFCEFPFSDIREGINSRSADVRRLTRGQCGPHQQDVRGVKAGEV